MTVKSKGEFKYKITDMSGVLLETGNGTGEAILGNHLNKGMYLLSVENKDRTIIHKIIKVH